MDQRGIRVFDRIPPIKYSEHLIAERIKYDTIIPENKTKTCYVSKDRKIGIT